MEDNSQSWNSATEPKGATKEHFLGCLLGGAVGDALGGAAEFMPRAQILQRFGDKGITNYADAYGGKGKITDDTQMTLYTAEGLPRARRKVFTRASRALRALLLTLTFRGCQPKLSVISAYQRTWMLS